MKSLVFLCLVVITCVNCDHLIVGNVANGVTLGHHSVATYEPIIFIKRVINRFYLLPDNKLIEGIQALDNLHSNATIYITDGGVGRSYVNLRMKSERGNGLEYDISIYVKEDEW